MFESVTAAPADPILGLTEAFNADPNPDKINLSVGVYKDATGKTPVLDCVKTAEQRLVETEATKGYLPITGDPAYGQAVRELVFGPGHAVLRDQRVATAHTPGGTGALRVVGDYLKQLHPGATLWLSGPTWANHPAVFDAAGVPTNTYPYFDPQTMGVRFDEMLAAVNRMPAGDAILLHGCCHNPTGQDLTTDQWRTLAAALAERGVVPLVDLAYQGFGDGLEEDAAGVRTLADHVPEMFLCGSFSKNFGLYRERVGALSVIAGDPGRLAAVMSQVKVCVRRNYSNPASHGGAIVSTILADSALRARWREELAAMRDRINTMRSLFAKTMADKAPGHDFGFIPRQRGMFSMSGLSKEQVQTLRDKHALYIVGSGRINVAGMTEQNMDRLCTAIASVL